MRELFAEPIARHTTMRVGGPAERFVVAETTDEVVDAVRGIDDADVPLLVLGGGSNVVVADTGFAGTVVQVANAGVHVESADASSGVVVRVAAGEVWDDFVRRAVAEGWSGVEALSGVPGSVGATPVQNVGAYGQEIAQTVARVCLWDRQSGRARTLLPADCRFAYRHSILKESARYVVLEVTFQLSLGSLSQPVGYADLATQLGVPLGARVPLEEARDAVLAQRARRGMVLDPADHDTWSCGSFFTNPILSPAEFAELEKRAASRLGPDAPSPPGYPAADGAVKTSAAWLIERAGFAKGYGLPGPAAVSTKHTLAITNRGGANATDIVALAREIRDGVHAAFGVSLVNEPTILDHEL